MAASGLCVRAKILDRKAVLLPPDLRELFELPESEPIGILIRRIVMVNDQPIALVTGHLPLKVGDKLEERGLETKMVSALLAQIGRPPQKVEQVVEAVAADPENAGHLEVNPGAPLLRIKRIFYSRGKAIHHAVTLYRADRYRYVQSLEKTRWSRVRAAAPKTDSE
jgi:GntR family transcriptional regulator